MTFIRPEAKAALWRWREVLAGLAVAALGLLWATGPRGLLGLVGWVLVAAGVVLVVTGVQRLRFRRTESGPGLVEVDEGKITYFGPLSGGSVAARDLERITLDPTGRPPHWILTEPGHPPLQIPVNAEGSDQLFDAFAALPGLRTERMLAELNRGAAMPVVIWERTPSRPEGRLLH